MVELNIARLLPACLAYILFPALAWASEVIIVGGLQDDYTEGIGNETLWVDVFANDDLSAVDLQLVEFIFLVDPANGYVLFEPGSNLVQYNPRPGFCGLDSFYYALCDVGSRDAGPCDTAMVRVRILCQEPVAYDDVMVLPGPVVTPFDVLVNDDQGTGALDPKTLKVLDYPELGFVSVDRMSGAIEYRPQAACARDFLRYEICDQNGYCTQAAVDIVIGCEEFVVRDDTWTIEADKSALLNVLANDVSYAEPICLHVEQQPAWGRVDKTGEGHIRYRPHSGWTGTDFFTYRVCAGEDVGQAEVCVVVTPPQISIPRVFSPNGDGINDALVIKGLEYFPQNQVRIYDREGRLVYEAMPYENDWFGYRKGVGSGLPADTYYIVIKPESSRRGSKPVVGFTTIKR